jgi:hypothetical protein
MTAAQLRTVGFLLSAVLIFGSGIWLTRAGRPYGVGVTTVHKLVDLAVVIAIGVMVLQAHRAVPLSAFEWTVIGLAAVLAIATFATGGVLSASEGAPTWVLWVHRAGSWFAGALALASVYVIGRR